MGGKVQLVLLVIFGFSLEDYAILISWHAVFPEASRVQCPPCNATLE